MIAPTFARCRDCGQLVPLIEPREILAVVDPVHRFEVRQALRQMRRGSGLAWICSDCQTFGLYGLSA